MSLILITTDLVDLSTLYMYTYILINSHIYFIAYYITVLFKYNVYPWLSTNLIKKKLFVIWSVA